VASLISSLGGIVSPIWIASRKRKSRLVLASYWLIIAQSTKADCNELHEYFKFLLVVDHRRSELSEVYCVLCSQYALIVFLPETFESLAV